MVKTCKRGHKYENRRQCKICQNAAQRAYYYRNNEKLLIYGRAYRFKHRIRLAEYHRNKRNGPMTELSASYQIQAKSTSLIHQNWMTLEDQYPTLNLAKKRYRELVKTAKYTQYRIICSLIKVAYPFEIGIENAPLM